MGRRADQDIPDALVVPLAVIVGGVLVEKGLKMPLAEGCLSRTDFGQDWSCLFLLDLRRGFTDNMILALKTS